MKPRGCGIDVPSRLQSRTADIGLTPGYTGSSHQIPTAAASGVETISGLQSFADVRAPPLARPPGCSHRRASRDSGRPGLIHHAELGQLPAPSSGIATCLIRAIDMVGLSPTRLQPCRPLRIPWFSFCPGRQAHLALWGRAAPRTDPGVRNYLTGLLPRVEREAAFGAKGAGCELAGSTALPSDSFSPRSDGPFDSASKERVASAGQPLVGSV